MTMDTKVSGLWRFYKETAVLLLSPGRAAAKRDTLYSNSIFLIANAGAVLGFAFWAVVARLYSAEVVGLSTALLSAGGLLIFIATLGLGQGLIRYLPSSSSNGTSLINSSFTLSSMVAIVAAIIFLAGIPLWSPALDFARNDIRIILTFVIFILSNTLFSLLNDTYLALRRTDYTFVQGLFMQVVKLILVIVLAGFSAVLGILVSCTVAILLMVFLGLFFFLRKLQSGYRPFPVLPQKTDAEMIKFSFTNYINFGLSSLPGWILPVMVLNTVGSQANAHFFMGWSFAGLLFSIPAATSNSLFAECSQTQTDLSYNIKRSVRLIAMIAVPVAVILVVLGDKLLLVFGREYAENASKLLLVLVPSIVPLTVNAVYVAAAKSQKRMGRVLAMTAVTAGGTLLLSSILLPRLGTLGPGFAWLASQTIVALVVLPGFIKLLRGKETKGVAV